MVPILPNFSLGDLLLLYFNSHKYNQIPLYGHPLNTDTTLIFQWLSVISPRLHLAPFSRTRNVTFVILFASSPGKQSPYIFSKFNRLNIYENTPLIRTISITPPAPNPVSELTVFDCKCIQPFSNLTTANISAPSEA